MGNHQSQNPVSEVIASSLSLKARKRLAKSPLVQSFLEASSRTSAAPRNMPSITSTWYETISPQYMAQPLQTLSISTSPTSSPTTRSAGRSIMSQQHSLTSPSFANQDLNQKQLNTKSQTTTTLQATGNPTQPYCVVSTTTYYIKSGEASELHTDASRDERRLSPASRTSSSNSSSQTGRQMPTSVSTYHSDSSSCSDVKYMVHNNRRFVMAPGMPCMQPCDDDESDRLIIMHFLLKYVYGDNSMGTIKAMLDSIQVRTGSDRRSQALDIGCGPGTWVLEMATEFPQADFHGIDICPMFPDTVKPSNAYFRQCNILNGLPYADNTFDLVHVRLMLSCLTREQVIALLVDIKRVLKPGAYVELHDVDYRIQRAGPVTEALINQKLHQVFQNACDITLDLGHHMSTLLTGVSRSGGFVNIQKSQIPVPLGWGGHLGELHAQNLVDNFLKSLDPQIRKDVRLDATSASHTALTDAAVECIMQECTRHKSHLNWVGCYAQKPVDIPPLTIPVPPTLTSKPEIPTSPSIDTGTSFALSHPPDQWDSINAFATGYVD